MLKSHVKFHSIAGKRLVLIVDDEIVNREMLRNIVQNDFDVVMAEDGEEAVEKIKEHGDLLSLILLDLNMPKMGGYDVIQWLKSSDDYVNIPVIVLTGDKHAEVDSLTMGAADFLTKDPLVPEVVLTRMQKTIELYEDRSIIQSTEREDLTGLFNKEYFYRYSEQFDTFHSELIMDAVFIDINHFHLINELYGRKAGDEVLIHLSDYLKDLREKTRCIAGRVEADKFFVYIEHGKVSYTTMAEEINSHFDDFRDIHVRVRCGIYQNVDKSFDIETRFDRAVQAANTIKGNYSKSIARYDNETFQKKMFEDRLITEMDEAMATHQFYLNFQPKYNVHGEEPVLASAEVLVRWDHPELGRISPGQFIPIFEHNGLIQKLDFYIWDRALECAGRWRKEHGIELPLSVNVSRMDLYNSSLIDFIIEKLIDYDISKKNLYLEITESAYMDDSAQLIEIINSLRAEGFKIEMDDFGTGYSSLNMLADVPVDVLKMDMRFVQNLNSSEKQETMIRLIMDIAKYLKMEVVAEGVEDKEQVDFLRSVGCDVIQGYYFSKPLAEKEFVEHVLQAQKK